MIAATTPPALGRNWTWCVLIAVIALSCFRFAHLHLLWSDEDYHLAAALHMLAGKVPYRDFWYDKPPLAAFFYLLIGAQTGWPLRLLDAVYFVASCLLIYRLACHLWGESEGRLAAFLLAFFTTFYLPSTVIPIASDAIMLLPHLAALYCMSIRKPFFAGAFCGIALIGSAKGVFVFAVCFLWLPSAWPALSLGMFVVTAASCFALFIGGAWPGYVEQVWRLGLLYAGGTPEAAPFRNGVLRTFNWCGFHAAIVLGAVFALFSGTWSTRRRLLIWILLSFAAVAVGNRFSPHYFWQLLPAVIVAASGGILVCFRLRPRLTVVAVAILLLVPVVRFGPRYAALVADNIHGVKPNWSDIAMDLDSQRVAQFINARRSSRDTLFVWGYRPNIYVYTRLSADGLFWDSQPLSGVPADRHLHATSTIYSGPAQVNRQTFSGTRPVWFVDGLGVLNSELSPAKYPDLKAWLGSYQLVGRTSMSLIYRRRF